MLYRLHITVAQIMNAHKSERSSKKKIQAFTPYFLLMSWSRSNLCMIGECSLNNTSSSVIKNSCLYVIASCRSLTLTNMRPCSTSFNGFNASVYVMVVLSLSAALGVQTGIQCAYQACFIVQSHYVPTS